MRKSADGTPLDWFFPMLLCYSGIMTLRIRTKLFLTLLSTAVAVAACMFLVMRWSFDRGFLNFINRLELARLSALAQKLETGYASGGSWRFVADDPAAWPGLISEFDPDRHEEREPQRTGDPPRPSPPKVSPFAGRVVLLDAAGKRIAGPDASAGKMALRPLAAGGAVVGQLGLLPPRILSDAHQTRFAEEQRHASALIALAIVCLAGLLSIPLARQMGGRIDTLAEGTHRLASGDYRARVPETATDELGRLARDFNALALTLESNEAARRQWVADISHELRTPLSVLRGEIEALQDGVRPLTTQAVAMLHGEVMRLGRLVDDLYELSLSDIGALTYRKRETDLSGLLAAAIESFRADFEEKGIALVADFRVGAACPAFVDPERLHQLFSNLLENSLKYTNAGGSLKVALAQKDGMAVIVFGDSAPGVPADAIPRLFDRLYRVEGSRSRETGGAGLGLSICRNIVLAHGGRITAGPSVLGGLSVTVELPAEG
ncbi:MAG TPA: ATP-binding protein [Candidatus Deferrimicrobiaceae bacterium]|jgi:two-component system sensor histidine kinase BaeS